MTDRTVLHVIKRLDVAGGAERLVAELVRRVPGHAVLTYAGGASFHPTGKGSVSRARGLLHALWLAMQAARRGAIVHLHLFPTFYFALILGRHAVIHEHNTHNRRRGRRLFRGVEGLVYRRAGQVIAISDAAKHALRGWVGSAPTIRTVPNFAPDVAQSAKRGGTRGRRIAMVASFTAQKRQDALVRALVHMPDDVTVCFAGEGPTRAHCQALAQELGVAQHVQFLGAVTDVAAVYRSADLCVLLSHWEGFGMTVIEAAQCGLPTLVSDVAGVRDLAVDARFVAASHAPKRLAAQITAALDVAADPRVGERLAALEQAHSLERYLSALEAAYAA